MQSVIASASVSGSALGMPFASFPFALKIGRISNVHPGAIAEGRSGRDAQSIPATKVPCRQAALVINEHGGFDADASCRSRAPARPGCPAATGPSINPMMISSLPPVMAISGGSITCCNGSMVFMGVMATCVSRNPDGR